MRASDGRSPERLRAHYEIERELADRLRSAPAQARLELYPAVYDELFQRVPDHPQHTWRADPARRRETVQSQIAVLAPYLRPGETFLEIGAGDCALSLDVARTAGHAWAVDVSEEITAGLAQPENFELVISDGVSIPVPEGSVHLAYSNQLMEHLHPDDAAEQLGNIFAALAPGGSYLFVTPNRFLGPSDISVFFDEEATGFHLKEYTVTELVRICRRAGFSRMRFLLWAKWRPVEIPCWIPMALERLLGALPRTWGKRLARGPMRRLLGVTMVARRA